jgi:hypothetical protein
MDFRFEAGGAMVILNNMVGTLSAPASLAYV